MRTTERTAIVVRHSKYFSELEMDRDLNVTPETIKLMKENRKNKTLWQ